jgi:pyridoxamine 5'-phosphate oxidase
MVMAPKIDQPLMMSRQDYIQTELRRRNLEANPFKQFERWLKEALETRLVEPYAMTLATASKNGIPSARVVLLRGFDERGFVFYTNYESQKGREIEENPNAALVFYWAGLERQVRIGGQVEQLPAEESDSYFQSRSRLSQLGAWASKQGQVLKSRSVLEARLKQLEKKYQVEEVSRPAFWGGFCLSPQMFEFWQGRSGRLHDRFRYLRQQDEQWLIERLSP